MIRNYFKIAWRNLLKNKMYSFVNIFGLAVGMAVTIMIGLWVSDELSHDDYFVNKDRIAQIMQSQTFNDDTWTTWSVPRPLEFALREGYSGYFKYVMMASQNQSRNLQYGEKSISKTGNFMQDVAPEFLNLEVESGVQDGLKEINSIMLSKTAAMALFGEENPIGKIVKMNSMNDLKVSAVYKDIPSNNSFSDLEFIIPWEFYVNGNQQWIKNAIDNWEKNSFQMFVQILTNVFAEVYKSATCDYEILSSQPKFINLFLYSFDHS